MNPSVLDRTELTKFSEVVERDSNEVWSPTDSQRIACQMALQAMQMPNVVYSNAEICAADMWAITTCLHHEVAPKFRISQRKNKPTAIGYRP